VAGWTKADFDAAYKFLPESYLGGVPGDRTPVRVHYVRAFVEPIIRARWENIVPVILNITAADHVVIVGAGFGWGVEVLAGMTGANVVGVDISDYIDDAKDTDEEADYDAAITAAGLDPAGPRGQQIKAAFHTPGPRSNVVVLKENMSTAGSRNKVRNALGNNIPTHIITEDAVQLFTDAEITDFVADIDPIGATVTHIHGGKPRTGEELHALTGHTCIQYGRTPFKVVPSGQPRLGLALRARTSGGAA
jgi:hypothetical protein